MVYHVTDTVAETSHLVYALEVCVDDISRCQEMIARLQNMKADDEVPQEIREFIDSYIGTEGFVSAVKTTGEVIGKVLGALKDILVRLFEIVCDIFKLIFDTEYRVRRQFTEIQRSILTIAADLEAKQRFESIPANVISQEDCLDAIGKAHLLINIMKLVGNSGSDEEIKTLLKPELLDGCKVKLNGGDIVDNFTTLAAKHWTSLAEAGWTLDGLETAICRHIDTLTAFETLKDVESTVKSSIKKAEREVNSMLSKNIGMEMVKPIQLKINLQKKAVKAIGESANILVKRTAAITTILRALHGLAQRVLDELTVSRHSV